MMLCCFDRKQTEGVLMFSKAAMERRGYKDLELEYVL